MNNYLLTQCALGDLEGIHEYLNAEAGPAIAELVIERLLTDMDTPAANPRSGRRHLD